MTRPLKGRQPRRGRPNLVGGLLTVLGLLLVGGVVWTILSWDPEGATDVAVPIAEEPASAGEVVIRAPETGDAGGVTIRTPEGTALNGGVVIREVGAPVAIELATDPDPTLLEGGRYGPIPRASAAGVRPFDAYRRPDVAAPGSTAPRIAIIIGGLGISQNGTEQALARLPAEVSLALAPYGDNLSNWAVRARDAGHELFLQVPFEPFDFPANDPGEHTLVVADPVATNIDRLEWLMARFTMYAGIVTYAGGRFTGELAALEPIVAELGRRGLMLVDDGASPRSVTAEAATGVTPFAQADMVIDVVAEPAAIATRLGQVEALARQRGYAVASGNAFPATIEAVRTWADGLRARGFELVPITALAVDPAEGTVIQVP